jgi:hypothetical protein
MTSHELAHKLLAGADLPLTDLPAGTIPELPKVVKAKFPGVCFCGCGGATKGRFVPGHDSRFHASAKNAARDEAAGKKPNLDALLDALPCEEARDEFAEWYEAEFPIATEKFEAAEAEKARKAEEKEAKAAAKLAAK